jgi:hypothetical protein
MVNIGFGLSIDSEVFKLGDVALMRETTFTEDTGSGNGGHDYR